MSKSLMDALGEGAWSVSAVVFDLNDMLDDEGRPVSERRADAVVRAGVEFDMRPCPYHDIREGHLMNVSALAQITQYQHDALAEMAAFRRAAGENASWFDMLACIVDLLSQPAIYLLQHHSERGPVPAKMAVCHKLAAGFFGVLRDIHERLALGANIELTTDGLMEVVNKSGALLGANEACAGPPQMIRRACAALMEGNDEPAVELTPQRLAIARCLALQVQLGIFWDLYDRMHQWDLIRGELRAQLTPGNAFLDKKLKDAFNELDHAVPPRPDCTMLPHAIAMPLRATLGEALCETTDPQLLAQDVEAATRLLNEPGSAIRYTGDISLMALRVARYLHVYHLIVVELNRLELELRGYLGYAADRPIRLGTAAFPKPQALPWYELIVGKKLGADGHLTGSTTGVRSTVKTT